MTTLKETLSALSEAVPALATKVEAAAHAGDAFTQSCRDTIADFHEKRLAAEEMVGQLAKVFDVASARGKSEQQRLEELVQKLSAAVDRETEGLSQATSELEAAGAKAGSSLGTLESHLTQASERTSAAHESSRAALVALGEQAGTGQGDLHGAVDETAAAFHSVHGAVTEAHPQVSQGATALHDAMGHHTSEARDRVGQLQQHIQDQEAAHQTAISEADTAVEQGMAQHGQQVAERLEAEIQQQLAPELEAVGQALQELAQQVEALQAETAARREKAGGQLAAVAERIPPLQAGAQQVHEAAEKVGIAWP